MRGDLRGARLREGRRAAAHRANGTTRASPKTGFDAGENIGSPLQRRPGRAAAAAGARRSAGCCSSRDEAARAAPPGSRAGYRSQRDGRGPHAWQNHWLFVPLFDRRGGRIGYIWADDPLDRLQPDAERLQILRAFANQATTALEQAAQFEEIQNAYAHHRALIDASPMAIIDFDFDGRVRSWNAGAAEMFGWTAEETIGRISPIVPEDELHVLPRQHAARSRAGETCARPRPPPPAPRRLADRRQHRRPARSATRTARSSA